MNPAQYQPGQILPGTVYRVVRHLATGGMGSVYDVEDVTVEKRYVLKTLHPNLVSREDLALRMRDEAKSLAKLEHPNIVDVVTAGVTNDAQKMPFYVMERLIGQNLRVVLDKTGVLNPGHAYRIAIDVLDALEHAHENNIVHRDVKPENIFLHRNANGTTTTKLLDFGIVRLLDRKASRTHGKFIGTLRYASPEQITGERVGPATDIYSLGVVLFEMLCGRGPFDEAGDAYAVGAAHAGTPAPPLSRFIRGVSAEVERLVASALAKDPAERPRDCFAFAGELRRILREYEASPRSATAVNLITSTPPPTQEQVASTAPTIEGMIAPTAALPEPTATIADAADVAHATTRADLGALALGEPVSPIAPTLAAAAEQPATPKLGPMPAPVPAAGAPPNVGRAVDRNALTRESAPIGSLPQFARNDTVMELERGGEQAFGVPAVVHTASSQAPAPHALGSNAGNVPLPPAVATNATGPLSAEATTRPPERGPFVFVGVAAVLAVAMVGGAIVAVRRPWQSRAAAAEGVRSAMPVTASAVLEAPNVPASTSSSVPAVTLASTSTSATASTSASATASTTAPGAAPGPTTTVAAPSGVKAAARTATPTPTAARSTASEAKTRPSPAPGPIKEIPFDP